MTSIDIFSTAVLPLELYFLDRWLGQGTGFLWRSTITRQLFIVTNWHVVSAKNFFTRANTSKTAARPNHLLTRLHIPGQFESQQWDVPLRDDDDQPLWLVHPSSRYDIAVVPLNPPTEPIVGLYPLNEYANDLLRTEIGMDVFVLGYPFKIEPPAFPVWKRGSIASEPELVRLTGKGYMLVDTASRPGMSGAPVLQRSWGVHLMPGGGAVHGGDNRTKFLGVYSGRIPTDHPHEAQIGLVWDKSYIDEIIAGNTRDNDDY